jgi:hypothetical protein
MHSLKTPEPILLMHIVKIHRVYLNRRDNLLVLSKTTMKCRPLALYRVAKHGPAVAVTPVFTPSKPGLLSNLLVFYQMTSRLIP